MATEIQFYTPRNFRWEPPENALSVEIALLTSGGGGGSRRPRLGGGAGHSSINIHYASGDIEIATTRGAGGGNRAGATRDSFNGEPDIEFDVVIFGGNGTAEGQGRQAGAIGPARAIPARYKPEDFQADIRELDPGNGGWSATIGFGIDDAITSSFGGGAAGMFMLKELDLAGVSRIDFIIGMPGAPASAGNLPSFPTANSHFVVDPPVGGNPGLLRLTVEFPDPIRADEDCGIEPLAEVTLGSDQSGDYCELVYGEAPCTAMLSADNPHKCFNTFWTCQDKDNYRGGNLDLNFSYPRSGIRKIKNLFPLIDSISTSPTELNPDGRDNRYGPLGKRAGATIVFNDMPYNDIAVDKYQAERISGAAQFDGVGYNPETRGTFWTKWRARNEYYTGRIININEGYLDISSRFQSIARAYVIERFEGPDSRGKFRIIAKDILSLASQDKAIAPIPSTGEIAESINEEASEVTLEPGDFEQYDGPDVYVRLGDEIIQISRNDNKLLLNKRGAFGSSRESHEAGELVQRCLLYRNERIDRIIRDLLLTYAHIPESYLDNWDAEASQWLESHSLTNIISEPTGVDKIMGGLMNLGCYIWWDERLQKVRLRAVRPEITTGDLAILDDDSVFLKYPTIKDFPSRRISQLYLYYAPRDYTASLTSQSNYRRLQVFGNPLQERAVEYNEAKIVQVFAPWIDESNTGLALAIAGSLATRNKFIPREQFFEADPNRISDIWTGDVVRVKTRSNVSPTGEPVEELWQVLSAEETKPLEQGKYTIWPIGVSGSGGKLAFIMPNDTPDYPASTDEQKAGKACWIANNQGVMSDDEPGWIII